MLTINTNPASTPALTPNQERARDLMSSGNASLNGFFQKTRGDILRFLDGGKPSGNFQLSDLQKFCDDWQQFSAGSPGSFAKGAAAAISFLETITPGCTAEFASQLPAIEVNADGSITVSPKT